MCSSSQKSYRDCYESLGLFIKQRDGSYSEVIRESWLAEIKNELSRQRCAVWVQYAYQLEKMDSTGTISDRRLYLNHSNYDKLPALWRKRSLFSELQPRFEMPDISRFCRFLIDHGYESFNQLSPTIIKEFSRCDEHTTFQKRLWP